MVMQRSRACFLAEDLPGMLIHNTCDRLQVNGRQVLCDLGEKPHKSWCRGLSEWNLELEGLGLGAKDC